jgi:hypothetical protein
MNLKPEPQPFDELMKEYDQELLEAERARQREYDALPQWKKDALKQMHDEKVAADMQPHRLDLSDED